MNGLDKYKMLTKTAEGIHTVLSSIIASLEIGGDSTIHVENSHGDKIQISLGDFMDKAEDVISDAQETIEILSNMKFETPLPN